MDWQPGQWIKCEYTQEKGVIEPHEGKAICISLGEGLTMYATPQALENLGWKSLNKSESDCSSQILCSYSNNTPQFQIIRIANIPNWFFERVVFPGGRLVFEALPDSQLEIHTGTIISAILLDTVPCHRLALTSPTD